MKIHRHRRTIGNCNFSIYIPDADDHQVNPGFRGKLKNHSLQDKTQLSLLASRRIVIRAHGAACGGLFAKNEFSSQGIELRFLNNEGFFLENKVSSDALAVAPISSFVKASADDYMVQDHELSGDYITQTSRVKQFQEIKDRNFLETEIQRRINKGISKVDQKTYKLGNTTYAVMDMFTYFRNPQESRYLSATESYSSGSARKMKICEPKLYNTVHIENGDIRLSELIKWLLSFVRPKEIIVSCCRGNSTLDAKDDANIETVNDHKLHFRSYMSGEHLDKYLSDLKFRMEIVKGQPPIYGLGEIEYTTKPENLVEDDKLPNSEANINVYNGYVYYESLLNYCLYAGKFDSAFKLCSIIFKRFKYSKHSYKCMRYIMTQAVQEFMMKSNTSADRMGIEPLENDEVDGMIVMAMLKNTIDEINLSEDTILSKWSYIYSTLALREYLKTYRDIDTWETQGADLFWWNSVFGSVEYMQPGLHTNYLIGGVQELIEMKVELKEIRNILP